MKQSDVCDDVKLYNYTVRHDVYGAAEVTAADAETATVRAAEKWGVPWREIAGWCDTARGAEVRKVRCDGCGGDYYGRPGGLCIDCMRKRDMRRATMPKFRRKDRRV